MTSTRRTSFDRSSGAINESGCATGQRGVDGRPRARPARPRARLALGLAVAACLVMAMAAPVLGLGETPAGAATLQAPPCPPECGFVAAGDALLVPYVTVNPGPGWFALPADEVQSYVTSLRHNLSRSGHNGTDVNVAAARGCGPTTTTSCSSSSCRRLRSTG